MSKQQKPLMPKATAVWLVDNTTLTFKQIAEFCGMHELEIKGIADGEVARGVMGVSPLTNGQLTYEELHRCMANTSAKMQLHVSEVYEKVAKGKKKTGKYTPVARRQDKPDAIYWLLKKFPNISDATVMKLIGTTKNTISALRDRSHWNMQNIKPRDPVLLGICTQTDLDRTISKLQLENIEIEENPQGVVDRPGVDSILNKLSSDDLFGAGHNRPLGQRIKKETNSSNEEN